MSDAETVSGTAVARTLADLRSLVAAWRGAGETIGLVPTMGALHEGHLCLIDAARAAGAARIIVSVFVNPKQFAPHEDFTRYPRPEAADRAHLAGRGVDLAYMPDVNTIYPDGFATEISVRGPLTEDLEGRVRPGHFTGVATVVAKLLIHCTPDIATFGEKDYQQLLVVRRLVRDLDLPVRVLPVPTVRDEAGLALSSRNVYLSAEQLTVARRLNRVLDEVASGRIDASGGEQALLEAGFDAVDYLVVRDEETLGAPDGRTARVLAAARLGGVRLIDNKEARLF